MISTVLCSFAPSAKDFARISVLPFTLELPANTTILPMIASPVSVRKSAPFRHTPSAASPGAMRAVVKKADLSLFEKPAFFHGCRKAGAFLQKRCPQFLGCLRAEKGRRDVEERAAALLPPGREAADSARARGEHASRELWV